MTNQNTNESMIKQFANIPNPTAELEAWVKASEPTRALEETVEVKMAPSYFFGEFVKEYLHTIDTFFVGPFNSAKPQLKSEAFIHRVPKASELTEKDIAKLVKEGATAKEIFEAVQKGKESDEYEEIMLTEEELLCRYFETELWAVIAYFKREYCRKPHLKELLNFIGKQKICTPIFFVNTLNCIGPVQLVDRAIRLEPTFVEEYEYEKRILTKEQMIMVSDWFCQLQRHGFKCVEYLKLGANGNRDFMMMTFDHNNTPSKEELNGDYSTKTQYTVLSTKLSHNIIGLYRYFYYTKKVKYLSDDRRIFQYATSEENLYNMRDITRTMLNLQELEKFTASNGKQQSTPKPPNQDPAYQAEQSRDDKAQHND